MAQHKDSKTTIHYFNNVHVHDEHALEKSVYKLYFAMQRFSIQVLMCQLLVLIQFKCLDCHDITEILLKVALSTMKQTNKQMSCYVFSD